ncbi:hypothetical protein ZHAS_00005130 [Anopheles sinensis]|uniref:Uncharacterized protein n=1 Tax=Anopheles sinensis TaxID=74873 RepID=A0A084VJ16_ANOSI|nr:hypothetical protein ZHAS_00005130 [Anopheles sinensis]
MLHSFSGFDKKLRSTLRPMNRAYQLQTVLKMCTNYHGVRWGGWGMGNRVVGGWVAFLPRLTFGVNTKSGKSNHQHVGVLFNPALLEVLIDEIYSTQRDPLRKAELTEWVLEVVAAGGVGVWIPFQPGVLFWVVFELQSSPGKVGRRMAQIEVPSATVTPIPSLPLDDSSPAIPPDPFRPTYARIFCQALSSPQPPGKVGFLLVGSVRSQAARKPTTVGQQVVAEIRVLRVLCEAKVLNTAVLATHACDFSEGRE